MWFSLALATASIGLAVAGQYCVEYGFFAWGIGLFVAATFAAWGSCLRQSPLARHPWTRHQLKPLTKLHTVLAGICIGANIAAFYGLRDTTQPASFFWPLHVLAIVSFFILVYLLDPIRPLASPRKYMRRFFAPAHRKHVFFPFLFLGAAIVVGAVVRLWQLTEVPYGTWYDEAENGLRALQIFNSQSVRPLYEEAIHAPAHYLYLIAVSFSLQGVSVTSIRMISVVMGILSIPAMYLCARELMGRPAAIMAAWFIAVSRWHITISRVGMYNISTPLFTLLSTWMLLKAIRTGSFTYYAAAGLMLGLGFCFYAAFQFFILVAVIGGVLLFLVKEKSADWPSMPGFLITGAMFFITIAPVLLFAYQQPEQYFSRTRDTSLFNHTSPDSQWLVLKESIQKHILMFNYKGDPNGRHNLPKAPMLGRYSAALMVVGVALCMGNIRRWRAQFILLWFFGMLMPGVLSIPFEAPQSLRSIGTLPVAYLLAALPLHHVSQYIQTRLQYSLFIIVCIAVVAASAWANIRTYFVTQARSFAVWNAHSTAETITSQILKSLDSSTEAYVTSYFAGHPALRFPAEYPHEFIATYDYPPVASKPGYDVAFILNDRSEEYLESLKTLYPHAQYEEYGSPYGGAAVVYFVLVPAEEIARVSGLTGTYYPHGTGTVLTIENEPSVHDWTESPPLPHPFIVEWEGSLLIPRSGLYTIALEPADAGRVFIDGVEAPAKNIPLAQGIHRLAVTAGSAPALQITWVKPGYPHAVPIPIQYLFAPSVTTTGLLGQYFQNDNWVGKPALTRIDKHLNIYFHTLPLRRPYTVQWSGTIGIETPGIYEFSMDVLSKGQLLIDKKLILDQREDTSNTAQLTLMAGNYPITVRFADLADRSHMYLYWTPPDSPREPVPSHVLTPDTWNRVSPVLPHQ